MSEDVPILEVDGSGDRGQKGEEGTRLIAGGTASSSAVLEQEAGSASDTKDARRGATWQIRAAVFSVFLVCNAALILALIAALTLWWPEQSVTFFVVGDWGRDGLQNQSAVANAMAAKALKAKPAFIISVGDNIYESGLVSADDPQFVSSFSDVYHHKSLQVPWHVILGNHDYGEFWNDTKELKPCANEEQAGCYFSPLHQLNASLVERDSRWHCERWFHFQLLSGEAELFFIDTNPFILDYWSQPWAHNKGGIMEQSWESQLLELDARLAASDSTWKLVFGHHPVRNNHMPSNTPELVEHLEPVLLSRGVQAYFSGHEHNLQHLHVEDATTHYVVSGGGSKTDYFPELHWDNGGSLFQHQGSGFVTCTLRKSRLQCDFIGVAAAAPLYAISIEADR